MRKFIFNSLLYSFLLALIIVLMLKISSQIVKNRNFKNYQTESTLLVLKDKTNYDILLMGISHAREFSKHMNHIRIESIFKKSVINIGQGGGVCGVNEQLFYLDYFYHLKNHAQKVVYVLSPPILFSETLTIASNTFENEPFEISFLLRYLFFNSENKKERISTYLLSKLTKQWLYNQPSSKEIEISKLDKLNLYEVSKGQRMAYMLISLERFNKNSSTLEATVDLALANDSEVILIIPPALFGKWLGHERVKKFAKRMSSKKGVQFYDHSETVLDPKYYYDHHHLNSEGVVFYTRNFLDPIINR